MGLSNSKGMTVLRNLLLGFLLISEVVFATSFTDSVKIGASGPADSKSILDASSTTRGVLLPRMTTTQQNAITSPTEGLIIYDNVLHKLSNYNGTAWVSVGGGGSGTVAGPLSSTVNNLALWNATDGTVLKDSSVAVSGSTITASLTGNVTGNVSGTSGSTTGNAATVTTNANLTGPITSVGNATSVASQTGTGSKFVMDTSPILVTPNLGTPSTLVGTNITGTASGLTAGTVTTNANLTGNVTSVGNATTIAAGVVTNSMLAGSIAASKLIGSDIATVGTITSGTWSGTAIALNKITALGTAAIPYTDGSGFLTTTTAPVYDSTNKVVTVTGDSSAYKVVSATDSGASGKFAYNQSGTSLDIQAAQSSTTTGSHVSISTSDIAGSNANSTGQISILTGSKTAGTGDSGKIALQVGTSAGGARGRINIVDGTESAAAGMVWTSNNNAGGGHWMKPTGDINFIANPDAEFPNAGTAGTPAWATYADAAGALPVDGTGGASTVTWTRTTSSPLAGAASFLFTKDAANRQGNGASFDFTINSASQAKVMSIDFDYSIASGTFVAGSPGVDSDIEVYIYDVTNAVLIQPSTYKLFSSASSPPPHFNSSFQTASNSTSYRLIFHTATTSASAYTVKFDSVTVSPSKYTPGTPITDWAAYTPVLTNFGTATNISFKSRRVGDTLEVQGSFTAGTTVGTQAQIGLGYAGVAANVTVDTTKIAASSIVGILTSNNSSTTLFGWTVLAPSANQTYVNIGVQTSTTDGTTAALGNAAIANTKNVLVKFAVPIVGWSSSVQMSDSAPQSVVGLMVHASTGVSMGTLATSVSTITWNTVDSDTHGAYNTTTGVYTIPVPGYYDISAQYNASGTQALNTVNQIDIRNVTTSANIASGLYTAGGAVSTGIAVPVSIKSVYLTAGTQISIRSLFAGTFTSGAYSTSSTLNYFTLSRVSGPQSIGATETVAGRYFSSVTALTGSFTTMTYATKDFDTHSAYSGGTLTIPTPGKYQFNAGMMSSVTGAINNALELAIFKNGTQISSGLQIAGGSQSNIAANVSDIINCNAGDLITIRALNNGTSPSITASNFRNYFSWSRIGL